MRMFAPTIVVGPPRVLKDTSLTAAPDESITIINVGAVGQPRDGDPRAAYAVFDDQTNEVELRRVEYDVETTRKKILASGLPEALAQRIGVADAKGGVISEEDVQPADAEEA
jgi:diadenosine tetraphosphatase ApaH/serine/threonine PP2A family protein phosphatase